MEIQTYRQIEILHLYLLFSDAKTCSVTDVMKILNNYIPGEYIFCIGKKHCYVNLDVVS